MTFDVSKFVSFDLETWLVEPGILAPRIVCGSWARDGGAALLYDGSRRPAVEFARGALEAGLTVVGANIAYDFGCLVAEDPGMLPAIFRAYAEGRVFDVQLAQALHAIACGNLYCDPTTGQPTRGRYSLDRCVQYVLGRDDAKARDDWRLRYALLDGVALEDWPADARQYPVDDAVNTLEVAVAQVQGAELKLGPTPGPHRNLGDLSDQCETAFALHLGAIWGLRTDRERVVELRRRTEEAHASFVAKFSKLGFYVLDKKTKEMKEDQRAVKRAIIVAYGGGPDQACPLCVGGKVFSPVSGNAVNCKDCSGTGYELGAVPKTPTGGVKTNRDTLVESGDPDLVALGDNEPEKVRETYLPFLEGGLDRPISLRPNVLVASGRTSYDGLIQLLPRLGDVRGCLRARDGYVYCSADFAALELCTLAQVTYWLFGRSQMMETINATGDPGSLHTALAAGMAGVSSEEMTGRIKSSIESVKLEAKKYRQAAKALNFGLPGGMGAAKLVLSKRQRSEGETVCADGFTYPGIRFCVLLLGAERCGVEKVTEWRDRPTPPICRACVQLVDSELKPAWFRQWPEIKEYFDWVKTRTLDEGGDGEFPCLGVDRVRGGLGFCDGANNGFQALGADAAKAALRAVTRDCYGVGEMGRESPLYGGRPIFFTHDEVFSELRRAMMSLAAKRKARLMVDAARVLVPDVTLVVEPALMRWWDKNAEPVWRGGEKGGELLCWEDRDVK